MELFGLANLWIPTWFDRRLPHIDVDRHRAAAQGNVIALGGRHVLPGLRVHRVAAAMPLAGGGDRLAMC